MQRYTEIPSAQTLQSSLSLLLNNHKTILSCFSGTAFPTTNLQVGMLCFRTEQKKLHQLTEIVNDVPNWAEVADLNVNIDERLNGRLSTAGGSLIGQLKILAGIESKSLSTGSLVVDGGAAITGTVNAKRFSGLLNASNLEGRIPNASISGTYNCSISGTAENANGVNGMSVERGSATGHLACVDSSHVTVIGRYLDFYATNSSQTRTMRMDGGSTEGTLTIHGALVATGNITAYSDERLKRDVRPIKCALKKVLAMRGVTYRRKDATGRKARKLHMGVIAQEVKAAAPQAVVTQKDGTLAVDIMAICGILIQSVNELNEKIEKELKK